MTRRIIRIDEAKCDGCGLCARACHEGAIGIVEGKAKLLREHFCDGLGDCLPACPRGAISFEEREAPAYDAAAVEKAKGMKSSGSVEEGRNSELRNWPVQIKLAPVKAPWLGNCDLLIAADCAAYARAGFHDEFIRGRSVLVGCPKLDAVDYSLKLSEIFSSNEIHSVTLARMAVPCCGGMQMAIERALAASGKDIPLRVVVIGTDGSLK